MPVANRWATSMDGVALGLVLTSAVLHASWNLLTKRAADALAFLWCSLVATCVIFLPLGLYLASTYPVPPLGWLMLTCSALLETAYFWALSQAYRYGDLSLVYPIARGVGPLLVPLLGVVLLGEHLSPIQALGIGCIVAGVLTIHLPTFDRAGLRRLAASAGERGTRYALLTGLCISSYSIIDKLGVTLVPPPLYGYGMFVGSTIGLSFLVLPRRRAAVAREWRQRAASVIAVGVLSPTTFGLVLIALSIAPVSYVIPAREVSVVVAAILGALVLREGYGRQRILGSVLIASGLVLLVAG